MNTRDVVYEWLLAHPGCSLTEIERSLGIAKEVVFGCLKRLTTEGVIQQKKQYVNYKRLITYWPKD
jgi:predicted transcriptional regulator